MAWTTVPAISVGLVCSMDKIGLRAVDPRTRRPRWRYPTTAGTLTAGPDGKRLCLRQERRTPALPPT